MSYNTKNYTEQGGEKTVIGGTLEINGKLLITDDAEVDGVVTTIAPATAERTGGIKAAARTAETDTVEVKIGDDDKAYVPKYPEAYSLPAATEDEIGGVKVAANQAESTEAASPTVAEFNALLAALKAAGIMAPDEVAN
jgi:hypothetical protein